MNNPKVIPMLFNTEMVNALLQGRKTQTRRPVKMPEGWEYENLGTITSAHPKKGRFGMFVRRGKDFPETDLIPAPCAPGDLIYVRETFAEISCRLTYKADDDDGAHCVVKRWIPSIHMPRSDSRITLKVTGVRVEQVQTITKEDATAEGFDEPAVEGMDWKLGAKHNFMHTWDKTYKNWNENPWVWVITLEVIEQNVDDYLGAVK